MAKPPKDPSSIEHLALLGEAYAEWQGAEQVAEGWRRYLIEVLLVVEETTLEAERRRAEWFSLEFEPD